MSMSHFRTPVIVLTISRHKPQCQCLISVHLLLSLRSVAINHNVNVSFPYTCYCPCDQSPSTTMSMSHFRTPVIVLMISRHKPQCQCLISVHLLLSLWVISRHKPQCQCLISVHLLLSLWSVVINHNVNVSFPGDDVIKDVALPKVADQHEIDEPEKKKGMMTIDNVLFSSAIYYTFWINAKHVSQLPLAKYSSVIIPSVGNRLTFHNRSLDLIGSTKLIDGRLCNQFNYILLSFLTTLYTLTIV